MRGLLFGMAEIMRDLVSFCFLVGAVTVIVVSLVAVLP